jgi:fatty-acid peroxygenase
LCSVDEAVQVIAAAVLPWAGVHVGPREQARRAAQLATVVDGFATPVRPYLRAVTARALTNRWLRRVVRDARARRTSVTPPGSGLDAVLGFRDEHGRPLSAALAAVELHNIVRPSIAVAWFVAFADAALQEHPDWCARIAAGDDTAAWAFAHEVRRRYPFVPVLAARTRTAEDIGGVPVPRGGFVLLDVHGTTHDPAYWPEPDDFDPERFLRADYPDEALIPQGGGDRATGHRCPGEDLTLTILQVSVRRLAGSPRPDTEQEIGYDATRVPPRPQVPARTRNWSATAATRRALLSLVTRFRVQG